MSDDFHFDILAQPDDATCGPTCLQALYRHFGDPVELATVVDEVQALDEGGTLAVFLACHALRRGYSATIYTFNLILFDPTWFTTPGVDLRGKLREQRGHKRDRKLQRATDGYLEFLERGGVLRFEDLTLNLLRRHLKRGRPLLCGLSATYLYHAAREIDATNQPDDVRGVPAGHFVVIYAYDQVSRHVLVADPLHPNPFAASRNYSIAIERALGAVLLGVLTYDANLLIIEPRSAEAPNRGPDRG